VLDDLSASFDFDHLRVVWQEKLPIQTKKAEDRIAELMYDIQEKNGEGLILRKPESIWLPRRTQDLLKVKPSFDSEAVVLGYVWGKGKLENLMGTLVVAWQNQEFELSGFTNVERELVYTEDPSVSVSGEPKSEVSDKVASEHFPRGSKVTFKFRELSVAGIPKEARYLRPA
jgi:DNA ligase-1